MPRCSNAFPLKQSVEGRGPGDTRPWSPDGRCRPAAVGVAGLSALGFGGIQLAPDRYKARLGLLPDPYIHDRC
jgi:hypothetical protein